MTIRHMKMMVKMMVMMKPKRVESIVSVNVVDIDNNLFALADIGIGVPLPPNKENITLIQRFQRRKKWISK